MNNTVALPELAAQAARVAGINAEAASRIIMAIFNATAESVAAGEAVTLKGIGTFRRGKGSDSQVQFTPAPELAEAVNAPFALFSPMDIPADAPTAIFDSEPEQKKEEETPAQEQEELLPPPLPETMQEPEEPEESEPQPEARPVEEKVPVEEPENETIEDEEDATEDEPEVVYVMRRSAWPWVAAILCLIVGFAGGYCYGTHCGAAEGPATAVAEKPEVLPADSIAAPAQQDSTATEPADTVSSTAEEKPEPEKEPVYDTVTSTRFLTTIARTHYGRKDFWVFIYEANSDILRHPNRIRPGTRVRVPDLGPHAAADSATRAKAHQLANEIYSRYDM